MRGQGGWATEPESPATQNKRAGQPPPLTGGEGQAPGAPEGLSA